MSVERLDSLQAQLDELREEITSQQQEQEASPSLDPRVQQAGVELARAVSASLGYDDLPLQVAEGSATPVIELPEELLRYGGVGVAVVVAPPTEAARRA